MKVSSMLYSSVIVLAMGVLSIDVAFAAANLNSSRSNIYRIDANDPNAVSICIKSGGTVVTNTEGNKVCVTTAPGSPTTRSPQN